MTGAYAKALEVSRAAAETYRKAVKAYRAGDIDDAAFGLAIEADKKAIVVFDAAFELESKGGA